MRVLVAHRGDRLTSPLGLMVFLGHVVGVEDISIPPSLVMVTMGRPRGIASYTAGGIASH